MNTLQYQNRDPAPRATFRSPLVRWTLRLTSPAAWGFAAIFLLGVFSCLGFAFAYTAGLIGGIIASLFVAVSLRYAMRSIRRARGIIVLGYLENAVRLNFPLPQFLRAAALGEPRVLKRRLVNLAQAVENGENLGSAVAGYVPEIPPRTAAAILAAERVGQLRTNLTRLLREARNDLSNVAQEQAVAPVYYICIAFFCGVVILGTIWLVVPKFKEIFRDFNTTLPWLTTVIIDTTTFLTEDVPLAPILLVLMALGLIFYIARSLRYSFTPWWPHLVFGPLTRWLSSHVPIWRELRRNAALADTCQLLADATRNALPLPIALAEAFHLDMPANMRTKIQLWKYNLLQGELPGPAAAAAGMPRLLVGFLNSASLNKGDADLPQLFDFLAVHYRARFSRIVLLLSSAVTPLTTVFLALIVATIIVSLFLPLVKLVQSVSGGAPESL